MAFCTKCGKELKPEDKFCSGCGTPAGAEAPVNEGEPVVIPSQQSTVKILDVPDSDPVFRAQCEYCMCVFEYHTKDLGYRAWYPHGFIYCPRCKKPLRHRLENKV